MEYARIVPGLDIELVNDRFAKYVSSERVWHTKKIKKWRVFTGMYGLNQYYKSIYLENINEKLKGTIYEYAPIVDAINYLENNKIDFLKMLEKAKYPSFELLMKAELYELAVTCPEKFNKSGSFEKRFGISKNYYPFMKENNLNYKELEILKLYQKQNIEKIRYMEQFDLRDLEEICKYMTLEKFINYTKMRKNFDLSMYLDYMKFLIELKIDLKDKANLFPNDLRQKHDEYATQIKIKRNPELQRKIIKRSKKLQKNVYSNNEFFIKPATGIEDLENESSQQKHCVRTYAEIYAKGSCDIYFMRRCDKPDKSLVTIEVRDNKIYQARTKNNNKPKIKEKNFLKKWEDTVLKVA